MYVFPAACKYPVIDPGGGNVETVATNLGRRCREFRDDSPPFTRTADANLVGYLLACIEKNCQI